jgi:hypothetical protein
VLNNGTVPSDNPALDPLPADLVWDGCGDGSRWAWHVFGTAGPPELPTAPVRDPGESAAAYCFAVILSLRCWKRTSASLSPSARW